MLQRNEAPKQCKLYFAVLLGFIKEESEGKSQPLENLVIYSPYIAPNFRNRRMAETPKLRGQPEKQKINVPHLCLDAVKNSSELVSSSPSSPVASLRKTSSVKYNCLCSPTTHAGSFRCRYHRSSSLTRNSMSVGSKLSELAEKPDGLHAQ